VNFFVAGLSYKTAPVALRERLAVTPSKLVCHSCRLKICGDLDEVALLSTCNRVEIYGTTRRVTGRIDSLFRLLMSNPYDARPMLYVHENADAVRHLFSVASGLDSMVLGETEITGQVKHAYETARGARLTGPVLNRVFQKTFQTVKEIRTRTEIGRGATSVGSVAVELAEKLFGKALPQQRVTIIGAGQMGEACLRHLAKKGVASIMVSNRSYGRAQALAAEVGGRATRFDDRAPALLDADIVISSTGCPETILHRAEIEPVMRARRHRPLFLIDIAVPRDIDPEVQKLENVYLYNIDDLEAIVRANVQHREQELTACRDIIEHKVGTLLPWLRGLKEKSRDTRVQHQSGWLPDGAAVVGG
jgi:glutamyl-tRNA reductase